MSKLKKHKVLICAQYQYTTCFMSMKIYLTFLQQTITGVLSLREQLKTKGVEGTFARAEARREYLKSLQEQEILEQSKTNDTSQVRNFKKYILNTIANCKRDYNVTI